MKKKVALICPGGGMRCAYTGGVLTALAKEYGFEKPDIAIAASGGTGSLFYYLAKQYEDLERLWTKPFGLKKLISLHRREILDIQYLIEGILKKKFPLLVEEVDGFGGSYFIPATRVLDGTTFYFSNNTADPYELVKMSAAMPIFTNACVEINGVAYFDGEVGLTIEDLIIKAKEEGAEKIIVVWCRNSEHETRWRKLPMTLYALFKGYGLREALKREYDKTPTEEDYYHAAGDAELLFIKPTTDLPAQLITFTSLPLIQTFKRGYTDAATNMRLQEVLKEYVSTPE